MTSRAYVGHENDADMRGFIRQYPGAAGTRLDDCQTCHRGGVPGTDTEREVSPCSYCHLLVFPNARYKTGVPKDSEATLNGYGLAYKKAGRTFEAFAAIDRQDSDGDGTPNGIEVADRRNPGDPASRPGLPQAPTVVLGWDEIRGLPVHRQLMLMNTTKEATDDYVEYKGVRVIDLLSAAGIYLTGIKGITVFAPDGYSVDYSLADIQSPFPQGLFLRGPEGLRGDRQGLRQVPGDRSGRAQGPDADPRQSLAPARLRTERAAARALDLRKGHGKVGRGRALSARSSPRAGFRETRRKPGRPDRSPDAGDVRRRLGFYVPDMDHNAGAVHPRRLRHPGQPHARGLRGIRLEERLAAHRREEDRHLRPRRPLRSRDLVFTNGGIPLVA